MAVLLVAGCDGSGSGTVSDAAVGGPRDAAPPDVAVAVPDATLVAQVDAASPDAAMPDAAAPDAGPAPDFALEDVNPTSATFEQMVSPRDHVGHVSAWFFGHST